MKAHHLKYHLLVESRTFLINFYIKLDNLSKDDLVKLVRKYIILQKQLRIKNEGIQDLFSLYCLY